MIDNLSLLSELLGDESPGSIISVLRERNLATSLVAGPSWKEFSFTDFVVSIECTSDGINNRLEEIVKLVFDYITLVKSNLKKRMDWLLQEHQALGYIHFWFKPNEDTMLFISELAEKMQQQPLTSNLLTDDFLLHFSKDSLVEIQRLASQLTVDSMILEVVQDGAVDVADRRERWSGVPYAFSELPASFRQHINGRLGVCKDLKLPRRNPYIPRGFHIFEFRKPRRVNPPESCPLLFRSAAETVCTPVPLDFSGSSLMDTRLALRNCAMLDITCQWEDEYDLWRCPTLIQATESTALWLKQDTVFRRPEQMITCVLDTDVISQSLRTTALTEVYVSLITELLQEKTYRASVAGLTYSLAYNEQSLLLRFDGYSDTLIKLQQAVSSSLMDVRLFQKARFERIRTLLVNTFRQKSKEEPQLLCSKSAKLLLNSHGFSDEEMASEMERIGFKELCLHVKRIFQSVSLEMYVHGNAHPAAAEKALEVALKSFRPTRPFSEPKDKCSVKLKKRHQYYFIRPSCDRGNVSSAVSVIFQCGQYGSETAAILAVLTNFLHESIFNHLRTKQQLGYSVWAQHLGMSFTSLIIS